MVFEAKTNEAVLAALTSGAAQVAAGTAWLWGRSEMAVSRWVSYSLMRLVKCRSLTCWQFLRLERASSCLVIPSSSTSLSGVSTHPGLRFQRSSHLLNGHETIAVDQGIFLTETRRLHPDICAFTSELFYEGRLLPRPENVKQRLNCRGPLDGTGLHFVPVGHFGNQNESPEEGPRWSQGWLRNY